MSKTGTTPLAYQNRMRIPDDQSRYEEPEASQTLIRKDMLSQPLPSVAFGFTTASLHFQS